MADTAAIAQSTHNDTRCFQFTWLGPRYDNQSVFMNATCSDATQLAEGVPCQHPLVVSEDGTWPDIDYIWTHHFADTTCTLSRNDVCAKYTFYFNGHPENATYMCTRAVDTLDTAITSGCYEQTSGSYRTRVCFCRSVPGGVPCNKAPTTQTTLLTSLISIFSIFTFISFRFSTLLM
ncbi:uncharacterized protein LOC119833342 [Zerene cesonia]|uniref:uncharacterized protein LOC119833342 n=1 Tax=Zerene cesonia TaxID=33412 RepID=UPI0018E53698|nr:uncharacterized protein LOC119833342 [Zerene cesonia]